MPRDHARFARPLDIAVVGSGIAGLSAAWLLNTRHRVTVYEQDPRIGGHSHTVDVAGPDGPIPVDTGFIVYNELNYPNLTALFAELGVPTRDSSMSFAVSIGDGALEYRGAGLGSLFAQRRNILRPAFWRMLRDIVRFYRTGPSLLGRADVERLTLGEYLDEEGYSGEFIDHHLLPMAAAIWSSPADGMRDHPAIAFVQFCMSHGLMRLGRRPQWKTVEGGSRAYVRRLTAPFADRIRTGNPVMSVRQSRSGPGLVVEDIGGDVATYDHVVVATHADQALALLEDPTFDERRLLGAFTYCRNRAVLHRDPRLMPQRKRAWASWNYLSRRTDDKRSRVCVSYWMNSLQGLDARVPLFVTLNPSREPEPDLVEGTFLYDHPTYNCSALQAQRKLATLQGKRNLWFCGSYFGAGFHEDALSSGLAVAEALGGVRRPWAAEAPALDGDVRANLDSAAG